ncbi:MAG TPA: type II toxin-antitoxin system RelE/ParE family toxin, partial [Bacteroidia bacterium]|nr:type II toxin-antitoxin system RelE/ParE family toxin [Bacteroidia bacterium]
MAKKKIAWTETASKQRREILKYWTNRNKSPDYAEKLIKITKDRLKIISKNPLINKKAEFPDTRVAIMGHFSIFYK